MTLDNIELRQLSFGALAKLGLCCNLAFWLPIGLMFGLLALFHIIPVTVNQTPTFGVSGLVAGLVIGAAFAVGGAILFALGAAVARKLPFLGRRRLDYAAGPSKD